MMNISPQKFIQIDIDENVIKRIASEIAETAFEKKLVPFEWTDMNGVNMIR